MKLNETQAQHVAEQLQGQAIPEEHPNAPQLKEAIGDHTFFLNEEGLHVVEPGAEGSDQPEAAALRIGSWSQESEGQLFLHAPEEGRAVTLEPVDQN